jgi:hypothetical protein
MESSSLFLAFLPTIPVSMKNKSSSVARSLLLLPLFAVASLNASLLLHESFDYTVTAGTQTLTGTPAFYGNLSSLAAAGSNNAQVLSGSIAGPSASPFASSGNSLSWGGSLWLDLQGTLASNVTSGTTYYFSFLARASNTTDNVISIELSNGGNQRLQAGINGASFFATAANPTATTNTGGSVTAGTTYFIVGKMVFNGNSNTISMSAFAPGDVPPATEPVTWTATASTAAFTQNINSIRYRTYGGAAGGPVLDEFRLGTTWDAVAIPEPSIVGAFLGALGLGFAAFRRLKQPK